jgi:hypothetical protein
MSRHPKDPNRPTRRAVLGSGLAALALLPAPRLARAAPALAKTPPIFCTAYVNPLTPDQAGQEPIVARYPLALVAQDMRTPFRKWRDEIRRLNPAIVLLGYQNVITETRRRISGWCRYPTGHVPVVPGTSERRRLVDPRAAGFAAALIEACEATLAAYPFQGLFLDNCTIYRIADPRTGVREEMRAALAESLVQLRAALPDALIVGNGRYDFAGLNGEMNEGRTLELPREARDFDGHVAPRLDLFQLLVKRPDDRTRTAAGLKLAAQYGASFGVAVDYQHVLWFDFFEAAMAGYRSG